MEPHYPSRDWLLSNAAGEAGSNPSPCACNARRLFAAARFLQHLKTAWEVWRNYTGVVLSDTYLTSRVSRRTSWRWLMPLLGCQTLAFDAAFHELSVPLPYGAIALYALVSFGVSRIPISNLLPDALVMSALSFLVLSYFASMPSALFHFGARNIPLMVFSYAAIGINCLALLLFTIICGVFFALSPRATPEETIMMPVINLAMLMFCMCAEYCVASLFAELQIQLQTTQLLLDKATDGFCTVNLDTQSMSSVSPHLSDTFGCAALEGHPLSDCVAPSDRHKVAFNSRQHGTGEVDVSPILATCWRRADFGSPPTHVFDAQMHPYGLVGRHLHVFIKIVGELRECDVGSQVSGRSDRAVLDSFEFPELDGMSESASHVPLPDDHLLPGSVKLLVGVPLHDFDAGDPKGNARAHPVFPNLPVWAETDDENKSSHMHETASEITFDLSQTTASIRPAKFDEAFTVFEKAEAATQTDHASAFKPPVMPELHALARLAKPCRNFRSKSRSRSTSPTSELLTPVHSQFSVTPSSAAKFALLEACRHVNWRVPPLACCQLHAALEALSRTVKRLVSETQGCSQQWAVEDAWQCPECKGMNCSGDSACFICAFEHEDEDHVASAKFCM